MAGDKFRQDDDKSYDKVLAHSAQELTKEDNGPSPWSFLAIIFVCVHGENQSIIDAPHLKANAHFFKKRKMFCQRDYYLNSNATRKLTPKAIA